MNGTPRRTPGQKPTTRAERAKLPTCGAKTRSGKACKKPAGHGTDHPGEGRCRNHGGVGQKPSMRYAEINASPTLKAAIASQAADPEPLNLLHDLTLMRALVQDFVERHSQITDAVVAWHLSHTSGYQEAVALWREQLARYIEEVQAGEVEPTFDPPPPPIPEAFEQKPRRVPDLAEAVSLLDRIGAQVERIQKREGERSITLAEVDRVLSELGFKAVLALKEVIPDDADLTTFDPPELRRELGRALQRHWGTVRY